MSEPMSNHEIEDVLSSIRRLVSEDLRPGARTMGAPDVAFAPSVAKSAAQGEKLLLTPAFRVVAPVIEEDIATQQNDAIQETLVAPAIEEDILASGEFDANAQDPAHHDFAVEETSSEDSHQKHEHLSARDDWSMNAAPSDWSTEAPQEPDTMTTVEDVVARLGAAVSHDDAEWESPLGDVDALAESALPSDPAPKSFAFVHRPRATEAAVTPPAQRYDVAQDYMDSTSEAFAPVAEDEASDWDDPPPAVSHVSTRRVLTPPDGPERGWADAAEAAVMEDLARDVEQEVGGLFDDGQGGMTFDEEVLRDLVRDIIREELSGTLGERITRNVRKLVRAEIARALAVREFE